MFLFSWFVLTVHASPDALEKSRGTNSCAFLTQGNIIQSIDSCFDGQAKPSIMINFLSSQGITVKGEIPDRLLQFLYHYFSLVTPKKSYTIQLSKESGSRRVWEHEQTIYFAENALDGVLSQHRFEQAQSKDSIVEIAYDHTLYTQMNEVFLDHKAAIDLLMLLYGLKVVDGEDAEHQDFSTEELHNILSNLADMPPHILSQLRLREIGRAVAHKPLFHGGREASAIYNSKKQRITMSDELFSGRTQKWSSTFLHEVGHALWVNLEEKKQKTITELSFQERFQLSNWTSRADACFLSAYAQQSPEEDFAEHFAAFMEEPELFQHRCPQKYEFFKKDIFVDVRYVTQAHKKAVIYVDSQSPDSDPAIFIRPISKSIKAEMNILDNENMELTLEAKWLYDAHSGLKELCIRFEDSHGAVIQRYLSPDNLVDEKDGHYRASILIPREGYEHTMMRLVSVISTDQANNTVVHSIDTNMEMLVEGTKGTLRKHPTEPLLSEYHNVQQEFVKREAGENVVDITIPVARHEGLHRITVDWKGEHEESRISIYLTRKSDETNITFLEIQDKPFVTFQMRFPKYLSTGSYWMTKVLIEYEQDSGYVAHDSEILVPFRGHRALELFLQNPDEDSTHVVLDENALRLHTIENRKPNQLGGEKSIVMHIPIHGVDDGNLAMNIYMRAPSGKSLSWFIDSDMEGMKKEHGIYSLVLPLAPHHEKGTYLLEEVNFTEDYHLSEYTRDQIIFQSHNHQGTIVFKERGIRKTISISGSASHSEQF